MTAATREPGIKSVVLTSSSTAALLPQPSKVINVTKETWNQDTVDTANKPNPDAFSVYGASKTEAERAVWQAVKETNPPFQVSAVLPNMNIGPIIKPGGELSSSTASMVVKLFNGDSSVLDFPPVRAQLGENIERAFC
jgi:nucleoside-diphosphate-sugar epimerase